MGPVDRNGIRENRHNADFHSISGPVCSRATFQNLANTTVSAVILYPAVSTDHVTNNAETCGKRMKYATSQPFVKSEQIWLHLGGLRFKATTTTTKTKKYYPGINIDTTTNEASRWTSLYIFYHFRPTCVLAWVSL